MDEDWPEKAGGWELSRHDRSEYYRKRLANNTTVTARWEGERGVVEARVTSYGVGRTLSRSRTAYRDKESFFTAAHQVVEMAANLPSHHGVESVADSVVCAEVAGNVEAAPGCGGTPEAELTFTTTDGQSITLTLTDEQAFDLTSRIDSLDEYVWSEQREEEDVSEPVHVDAEVPDISEIAPRPETGADVIGVLARFGVGEDFLMAHVDWSAVIVVGEPAVSTLLGRAEELYEALHPHWVPGVLDRPGEQWVVLTRNFPDP